MNPEGGYSNENHTGVDNGFEGCRAGVTPPSSYPNGVVTPHASFLALRYAPREALDNLSRLRAAFPGIYGKWGFRDSVNVDTGVVSGSYLSLDQGMIMAALGGDTVRHAFADRGVERALRPVIGVEEFGARG
jgi:hypothetical protein